MLELKSQPSENDTYLGTVVGKRTRQVTVPRLRLRLMMLGLRVPGLRMLGLRVPGLRMLVLSMLRLRVPGLRILGLRVAVVTLQRVLELGLPKTMINSYSIADGNGTRLEGGGNIGRGGTHEGQKDDATKRTELCKSMSGSLS